VCPSVMFGNGTIYDSHQIMIVILIILLTLETRFDHAVCFVCEGK
jgi:hypothetical protein